MFTLEDRTRVRADLLDFASRDGRLTGGAITGSAAAGREDCWSDIDLAFGVREGEDVSAVLAAFTDQMYRQHGTLHHFDIGAGEATFRVFLLASTLQVDLSFAPREHFRPIGPAFELVFGEAAASAPPPPAATSSLIGYAWLYAVHVRSAIARGKLWQAEHMIGGMRNHTLALACVRHGVPAIHARGLHLLPDELMAPFEATLVRHLHPLELTRAFRAALDGLIREIEITDPQLAVRLIPAIEELGK
jgi:hypothetical protein